jgi:hypothetical protein
LRLFDILEVDFSATLGKGNFLLGFFTMARFITVVIDGLPRKGMDEGPAQLEEDEEDKAPNAAGLRGAVVVAGFARDLRGRVEEL